MTTENGRDLTILEYVVLGLISAEPQSGYSIIAMLEAGTNRWSASPGSIYPILKRLESQGAIGGELEVVHETRPRKVYRLTESGGHLLDEWLRSPLRDSELLDERDIVLIKFLFAEKRLSRQEVLAWLDRYEQQTRVFDRTKRVFYEAMISQSSQHQQLIHELTIMELNMQLTWIEMARARLGAQGDS